jgi:hypothetical protein
MRSTLIHYQVGESADSDGKWFNLDALRNHDFPLDRLKCQLDTRVQEEINWPQSFARRGLDAENYRVSFGPKQLNKYHFVRKTGHNESLPQALVFERKGSPEVALQGDVLIYQVFESGLCLIPRLVVANGVTVRLVRTLDVPRVWWSNPEELGELAKNVTPKAVVDWKRSFSRLWDLSRSWVYLSHRAF